MKQLSVMETAEGQQKHLEVNMNRPAADCVTVLSNYNILTLRFNNFLCESGLVPPSGSAAGGAPCWSKRREQTVC